MARETEFRMRASELAAEATTATSEAARDRALQRAAQYVRLAENERWLLSNSLSVPSPPIDGTD